MSTSDYYDRLTKAHYYDIAERYQDMAVEMREVLKEARETDQEITVSMRNLFSLAVKNLVSSRRSSWRVLYAERQRLEEKQSGDLHVVDDILSKIENELLECCDEVLNIISNYNLVDLEKFNLAHNVFFLKMRGDYYRYKAEVLGNEDEKKASDSALESYMEASQLAGGLSSTDPIRLGLHLNFSVFNYEILNNCEKACKIAQDAFSAAISELDSLTEDYYKDSTLIMQLLRDNLTLWTSKRDPEQQKSEDAANNIS